MARLVHIFAAFALLFCVSCWYEYPLAGLYPESQEDDACDLCPLALLGGPALSVQTSLTATAAPVAIVCRDLNGDSRMDVAMLSVNAHRLRIFLAN